MELFERTLALYGRFSEGARAALAEAIEARGGKTTRDLTRQSTALVVGARASSLIDTGALQARLKTAWDSGRVVFSEAAFRREIEKGATSQDAALPLSVALSRSRLSIEDAQLLAAFDLIAIHAGKCRFADSAVMQRMTSLRESGCRLSEIIDILLDVQREAPMGRYDVIVGADGRASLVWGDGHTTIAGQGMLPLDLSAGTVDDLFEAAVMADQDYRFEEAVRLYDMCARADRKDAVALYNLANVHLRHSRWDEAILSYRRALARDAHFVEARYNLAQALEASGQADAAASELASLLELDAEHSDALFNLAQLRMNADRLGDALPLYERYLGTNPPADWAAKARMALAYCSRTLAGK
jgi:tetratricopeptide (TPR) repeat protein